jgi:hypothetical protein
VMCGFYRNVSVVFIKHIATESFWSQSAPDSVHQQFEQFTIKNRQYRHTSIIRNVIALFKMGLTNKNFHLSGETHVANDRPVKEHAKTKCKCTIIQNQLWNAIEARTLATIQLQQCFINLRNSNMN